MSIDEDDLTCSERSFHSPDSLSSKTESRAGNFQFIVQWKRKYKRAKIAGEGINQGDEASNI